MKLGLWLCTLAMCFAGHSSEIAIVDRVEIMRHMPDAARIEEQIHKEFAIAQSRFQVKKDALLKKNEEAERYGSSYPPARLMKLRRDIAKMRRELKALEEELQEDFSLRQQEQFAFLEEKMRSAIEKYATKNLIVVVFDKERLAYALPTVDITQQVIGILNGTDFQTTDSQTQAE